MLSAAGADVGPSEYNHAVSCVCVSVSVCMGVSVYFCVCVRVYVCECECKCGYVCIYNICLSLEFRKWALQAKPFRLVHGHFPKRNNRVAHSRSIKRTSGTTYYQSVDEFP